MMISSRCETAAECVASQDLVIGLRAVLDQPGAYIYTKDIEGRYIYANKNVQVLFGASLEEIVGRDDSHFFDLEISDQLRIDDRQVLSSGATIEREEINVVKSSGEVRVYWTTKSPIRNDEGKIIGLCGMSSDISARKQIERYEQFRSATLEQLASNKPLPAILLSIVLGVEELNPQMLCSILLLDQDGKHLGNGVAPSLPDFYNAAIDGVEIGPAVGSCGTAAFTKQRVIVEDIKSHPYWALYHELATKAGLGACWSQPIFAASGEVLGTFAIYHRDAHTPAPHDIRLIEQTAHLASIAIERSKAESALRYSEQRFRDVSDAAGEYLWEIDPNMAYTYVSQRSIDVKGYAPDELIGRTPMEFMPEEDIQSVGDIVTHAMANKISFKLQHRDITKSGDIRWEEVNGAPFYDEQGALLGLRGAGLNITARKLAEVNIERLAFYDPLTQLPNRRLFMDRLKHALATSKRSGHRGALLFIDLDNFKILNDTLGHDRGDLLLQQTAIRLESCVREGDTVARLGGDEFLVILEDLSQDASKAARQAEAVCEKIIDSLAHHYLIDLNTCHSTPSIGVTLFDGLQDETDELIKQADIAMYQAKKKGRNTLCFFDPAMQAAIMAHASQEADLRNAILERDQLQLFYQPQVDASGRIIGAEALVRWNHPEHGMVSPAQFIPLAEESGLILPLGHWVLTTACQQLAEWAKRPETSHLTMAVNTSARQFLLPTFVEEVVALVEYFGISPEKLKLEITESMLLSNVDNIISKISALRDRGINFSMDDFGTGYSSLQYLKRLPLDQIKIDQSFVRDIVTDESDRAIVRTIIAMAESLNLNIIAEGVETEAQQEILLSKGCSHFQGYLYGRPVPIEQFGINQNLS